jgi:CO dehydrogenase maturation factor
MKIAITGKGGVGKTTITALIAQSLADKGRQVLAIDADPSPCLAGALGVPIQIRDKLHPIAQMDELIYERTGAKPGTLGGFFTINPKVDDIPEKYSISYRGIRLLEMGAVETGGSGCICPESALLKTLFTHLLFRKDDILILDMYAGVEHLGRATVDFVDAMLVIVEPTRRSLDTALQIKQLAHHIGLDRLLLIGNKVQNQEEELFIKEFSEYIPLLGIFHAHLAVQEADRLNIPVYDHVPSLRNIAKSISQELVNKIEGV